MLSVRLEVEAALLGCDKYVPRYATTLPEPGPTARAAAAVAAVIPDASNPLPAATALAAIALPHLLPRSINMSSLAGAGNTGGRVAVYDITGGPAAYRTGGGAAAADTGWVPTYDTGWGYPYDTGGGSTYDTGGGGAYITGVGTTLLTLAGVVPDAYNATVSPFAAAAGAIAAGAHAGGQRDTVCEKLSESEYTIRFRLAYVSTA